MEGVDMLMRFRRATLAMGLVTLAMAVSQVCAETTARFDLPAQPLADALRALGEQANYNVFFDAVLVAGRRSPALAAQLSPEEAIERLLEGSDLVHRPIDAKTSVIVPRAAREKRYGSGIYEGESPAGGERLRLASSDELPLIRLALAEPQDGSQAGAPGASAVGDSRPEEVVVTAQFYRRVESNIAAKLDLPLLDTPQAVSVINADVIKTFGITDLKWISKYVSGLDSRVTIVAENSDFTARGFTLDLEDGFKMNGFQYIPVQPIDTVAVERVEFLKGPSGILYGRNNYGGMLNYVTKQPQDRDFTTLTVSAGGGAMEIARIEMDLNTVLSEDKLTLRVPAAYERHDSTLDNDSRQFSVVPSLRWAVSEDLDVTLGAVLQQWRVNRQIGLSSWALGASAEDVNWQDGNGLQCRDEGIVCRTPPAFLREVYFGSAVDFYDSTAAQANIKLDYRITDRLRWFLSASDLHSDVSTQQHYIGTLIAEDGSAFLSRDAIRFIRDSSAVETGIIGDFDWFGRTHSFYLGGDYRRYTMDEYNNNDEFLDALAINVFNFRSRDAFQELLDGNGLGRDAVPYQQLIDRDREDWGLGAQVVLELADPLSLLVGGRYERSEFTDRNFELAGGCFEISCSRVGNYDGEWDEAADSSIFLPRVGATWKLVPDRWTAYVSYTEGFVPQAGITRSGGRIDPETGYQIELGVKSQLFGSRMLASMALWRIQREGVAVGDPDNLPGDIFVVGGLGQRNQGVELDVMGQITPQLNIILAASKTEGRFNRSSDTFFSGKEITSTPEYKLSGYLNYEFAGGALRGLSLGAGVSAVGPQWGVFPAALRVDSYTLVDFNLGYAFSDARRLSLQVQNLLDENYYLARGTSWDGCCNAFGDGRSVRLSFETRL
jgi:iron complex outermembrane recepter protein